MPGVYFDSRHLPDPTTEYVVWVDVRGIQSAMGRSISIAANFVFKLHLAILDSLREGISSYPVMDGAYLSSTSKDDIIKVLCGIFCRVAEAFTEEDKPEHRFVIRAAVAYGPVIHGSAIPNEASKDFRDNPEYRGSILLGMPMVQAHISERQAPPFGIYVHESARTFAESNGEPFHAVWWKWLRPTEALWEKTRDTLVAHYQWCRSNPSTLMYSPERVAAHISMLEEYFEVECS